MTHHKHHINYWWWQ